MLCDGSADYADVALHQRIARIIRTHSESRQDIRDVVRRALEWKSVRTILDLGCGYGWFEQALDGPFDLIAGIDIHEENRVAFLREAKRISGKAVFLKMRLPASIDMVSESFDLVVSSYSLYFFAQMLAEVARLLSLEGTFVVITHSEATLQEGEEYFEFRNLRRLIEQFSSENGEAKLRGYFSLVRTIDYPNSLIFQQEDSEDLAEYIDFKKGFIEQDAKPRLVAQKLLDELARRGFLRFNKNDRIFLARR